TEAAAELRDMWQRREVAAFTAAGSVVVIEIWRDANGLVGAFQACQGPGAYAITRAVIEQAAGAGVQRFQCEADTAAHARLYSRWGRWLQNAGVITQWRVAAVPGRRRRSPMSERTTYSPTRAYRVTFSISEKPAVT